jgi:P-type Ca2+ transporter type 2C
VDQFEERLRVYFPALEQKFQMTGTPPITTRMGMLQYSGTLAKLNGLSASGLTSEVAAERRQRFGPNNILEERRTGWLGVVKETAADPMIWLLAATSVLFAWTGDRVEALVLALAMIPILGMDAFLHRQTSVSTAALAGQLSHSAQVVRDGRESIIAAVDIVPGDLLIVRTNESFSADGPVVFSSEAQVDESALTGEALPVRKRSAEVNTLGAAVAGECWVSAGTRLLTGELRFIAANTGADTFYGQIVRSANLEHQQKTQLQRSVNWLVLWLTLAALFICLALAVTRMVQGFGAVDAFVSAATLAVAAMPEEFPVAITLFLAFGVHRLSRQKALVRRAVAVENIGRITCICSDKTGTITEGRLTVSRLLPTRGFNERSLIEAAAKASRLESGDPMDRAIIEAAKFTPKKATAVFPFTEDRRRETSILKLTNGSYDVITKGAPETILALCKQGGSTAKKIKSNADALSAQGMKVIACAFRNSRKLPETEPDTDFTFAGLIAFSDPVRPEVPEAVRQAMAAGIRVILVTGDHPETALAIAGETGIGGEEPRLIRGEDLKSRLEANMINSFDIVARATPLMKLQLVTALKQSGEIVAVTGDGVNDVPALQGADIGIAMGERGTRPAREAATIVLLNDSFATIISAITEGRRLFWSLRLSFAYLLMVHIPLVFAAALVPFAGYPLLFLPIHIVWLELILHPTAILAFRDSANSSDLATTPKAPASGFFSRGEWTLILLTGAFTSGAVFLMYLRALGLEGDDVHARSAGLATLIFSSVAMTLALGGIRNKTALVIAGLSLVSVTVLTQTTFLARHLFLSPLHFDDWVLAGICAAVTAALARLFGRGSN